MKKKERLAELEQNLEVPEHQWQLHRLYELYIEAYNAGDRPEQIRLREEAEVYFEQDNSPAPITHFAPAWADWNMWLRFVKTAWGNVR